MNIIKLLLISLLWGMFFLLYGCSSGSSNSSSENGDSDAVVESEEEYVDEVELEPEHLESMDYENEPEVDEESEVDVEEEGEDGSIEFDEDLDVVEEEEVELPPETEQEEEEVVDLCADFSECESEHRRCEVVDGEPVCTDCIEGYHERDGECVQDEVCGEDSCPEGMNCDDSSGEIECNCPEGFCKIDEECIPDGVADEVHLCRICNVDENPNGWSVVASGVVCRLSVGECDIEEVCDGVSIDCPENSFLPEGSACGDNTDTECDNPDTCNGEGECVPNFEPAGTVCAPSSGEVCDTDDVCDGLGNCVETIMEQGSSCDDGNPCTALDSCDGLGIGLEHCIGEAYSCNGHGTCNDFDDVCTCDVGYAPPYCDTCAEDYQDNDEDGTCLIACTHPDAPDCTKQQACFTSSSSVDSCRRDELVCDDSSGIARCITNGYSVVRGGVFEMGSPDDEPGHTDAEQLHEVSLDYDFEIAQHEFTLAEYRQLRDDLISALRYWWGDSPGWFIASCGEACPLHNMNWFEAVLVANYLSIRDGFMPCYKLYNMDGGVGESSTSQESEDGFTAQVYLNRVDSPEKCAGYRLPTAEEWEFAARAGASSAFYSVDGTTGEISGDVCAEPNLDPIAWYCGNAEDVIHPVAEKLPNANGLFDMLGNVGEWVWSSNPNGEINLNASVRGGAYDSESLVCRLASWQEESARLRSCRIGMRFVRTLDPDRDGIDSAQDNCPIRYNPTQADSDDNGIGDACEEYLPVEAGAFLMGGIVASPTREVRLTYSISVLTSEVTRGDFERIMGYVPGQDVSATCTEYYCPAVGVSWHEAAAYANELSRLEGRDECFVCTGSGPNITCEPNPAYELPQQCPGYRLPTEAEWEYFARAGSFADIYLSDDSSGSIDDLAFIAWFADNSGNAAHSTMQKQPNPWGLFDTIGNVREWTMDAYSDSLSSVPALDPYVSVGSGMVVRGCGFDSAANECSLASRQFEDAGSKLANLGFRIVRTLYRRIDNHHVLLVEKNTYDDASKACGNLGMYLASITSQKEQDAIAPYIFEDAWIGFSDARIEGQWEWIDGSPSDAFVAWAPGEPTNRLYTYDSAEMLADQGGLWGDMSYRSHRLAVCEDSPIYDERYNYIPKRTRD